MDYSTLCFDIGDEHHMIDMMKRPSDDIKTITIIRSYDDTILNLLLPTVLINIIKEYVTKKIQLSMHIVSANINCHIIKFVI